MKIAIVGAGAMGSVYAALFADAGHEVWAVDPWEAHVSAINSDGLRVEGASGDRTVTSLQATTEIADVGVCDLYIIATKASGVGPAAEGIAPLASPQSLILTIQNGLGAGERIGAYCPLDNVLLGVAEGFGASMKAPGHAHHNAMKMIRLGEINGGASARLDRIAQLWRDAGFDANAYDDIHQLVWEKFVCNVAFSAPCAVFERTIGEMMSDPEAWAVVLGCAREAFACGQAEGVAFSFDDVDAYVHAFGARMPDARPSLYLDHMAKRSSEIDAINGMVPIVGARHDLATPYNQAMTAVVRARETRF